MDTKNMEIVYLSLLYGIKTIADRAQKNPNEFSSSWKDPTLQSLLKIAYALNEQSDEDSAPLSTQIVQTADQILRLSYIEQNRQHSPIVSIFNFMDMGNSSDTETYCCEPKVLDERLNYPKKQNEIIINEDFYPRLFQEINNLLNNISFNKTGIDQLLQIMEKYLFYIPDNTKAGDLSIYDMSKIRAALASCIYEYQTTHMQDSELIDTKMFLMFSADFSGIQKFIYTISSKGALRTLRSRSFILEVIMEHIIDELLDMASVSRANLIYTGGGHCYILLPNTLKVREGIQTFSHHIKDWMIENFGSSLYLAFAFRECSGTELMNHSMDQTPYREIFRDLSKMLSKDKMQRYSSDEIIKLNTNFRSNGDRECKICGRMDQLDRSEDICQWCQGFQEISTCLTSERLLIFCSKNKLPHIKSFEVPGVHQRLYLCFTNEKIMDTPSLIRSYTKNRTSVGSHHSINLYMGDYVDNKFLNELAQQAEGIRRIGILRVDVDNLGTAFVSGFEHKSETNISKRFRYVSLIRTAAFSAHMSLFFKYHINTILNGKNIDFFCIDPTKEQRNRHAILVYSGGDDLFLIGAWNDTIESAVDIHKAFNQFSCKKLTLSGGIGIYPEKHPISQSAHQTADLEDKAKQMDGKNAISLFTIREKHSYHWNRFIENVLNEKIQLLKNFFDQEEQERGSAFLYRILSFLRESNNKINIARYAYMLARFEPKESSKKEYYRQFSKTMYDWILTEESKQELITAIYIYTYLERKKSVKGALGNE